MKTESQTVKLCLEWLKAHGCYVWRNNTGRRGAVSYGHKGSADIIGVSRRGRLIAIECKTDKGKISPEQEEFGKEINDRFGFYLVVRDIKELERFGKDWRFYE